MLFHEVVAGILSAGTWSSLDADMQATMIVADANQSLTITGNGDILEPHDGIIGKQMRLLMLLWSICA